MRHLILAAVLVAVVTPVAAFAQASPSPHGAMTGGAMHGAMNASPKPVHAMSGKAMHGSMKGDAMKGDAKHGSMKGNSMKGGAMHGSMKPTPKATGS